jgi:hypothetical protein
MWQHMELQALLEETQTKDRPKWRHNMSLDLRASARPKKSMTRKTPVLHPKTEASLNTRLAPIGLDVRTIVPCQSHEHTQRCGILNFNSFLFNSFHFLKNFQFFSFFRFFSFLNPVEKKERKKREKKSRKATARLKFIFFYRNLTPGTFECHRVICLWDRILS